jgi:hypothetical protein
MIVKWFVPEHMKRLANSTVTQFGYDNVGAASYCFDSRGFRTQNHNSRRLNVIGNSLSFGIGLNQQDTFGSQLAHMGILAELDRYDDVKKELQILAAQVRNFSHRVLPKSIDDGALISVLQEHMNWLNQENIGISFSLKTFDVPEKINPELALLIYLITLELISNAQKHGKATLIQMDIYAQETILSIHFFDNGEGFDVKKETLGFGLNQIKTRLLALNGSMEINSMMFDTMMREEDVKDHYKNRLAFELAKQLVETNRTKFSYTKDTIRDVYTIKGEVRL